MSPADTLGELNKISNRPNVLLEDEPNEIVFWNETELAEFTLLDKLWIVEIELYDEVVELLILVWDELEDILDKEFELDETAFSVITSSNSVNLFSGFFMPNSLSFDTLSRLFSLIPHPLKT